MPPEPPDSRLERTLAVASSRALAVARDEVFGAVACEDIVRAERRIEWASPDEPLESAVARMWWRQMGALPVRGDHGGLIGCLAEDDVLHVTARRVSEMKDEVEEYGADLPVWDVLLAGLTVADAMGPREHLAIVSEGTELIRGLEQTFARTPTGTRNRYVIVLGAGDRLVRIVSFRDVARYIIAVYDRDLAVPGLSGVHLSEIGSATRAILDLPIGELHDAHDLGHEPVIGVIDDTGETTLRRMWGSHRGYVVVAFGDGAPMGICTRRDILKALRQPFLKLGGFEVGRIMSPRVKTVSRVNTLCGLFKLMALEGCRHMPLLDADDHVQSMISMWEAVALLAAGADEFGE